MTNDVRLDVKSENKIGSPLLTPILIYFQLSTFRFISTSQPSTQWIDSITCPSENCDTDECTTKKGGKGEPNWQINIFILTRDW